MAVSAPAPYLIGHVTKHTEKGGILVETSIEGQPMSAWFGEKIVKTAEDGMKFIPEGAVAKKEGIGIKARVKLPNYAEEITGETKAGEAPVAQKRTSKSELMRKCIRAAKKVVDEELCCDLALEPVDFTKLRVEAILRVASSFYIDETKNARMSKIK
jgi:hypothetical protein